VDQDPVSFAYVLLKAVRERIDLTQQAVLNGGAKTMEDYRALTGELKGLQYTEREITEALDKHEKED
jgi:predicted  nucleic acid-binding Zn-ribbon protein